MFFSFAIVVTIAIVIVKLAKDCVWVGGWWGGWVVCVCVWWWRWWWRWWVVVAVEVVVTSTLGGPPTIHNTMQDHASMTGVSHGSRCSGMFPTPPGTKELMAF